MYNITTLLNTSASGSRFDLPLTDVGNILNLKVFRSDKLALFSSSSTVWAVYCSVDAPCLFDPTYYKV